MTSTVIIRTDAPTIWVDRIYQKPDGTDHHKHRESTVAPGTWADTYVCSGQRLEISGPCTSPPLPGQGAVALIMAHDWPIKCAKVSRNPDGTDGERQETVVQPHGSARIPWSDGTRIDVTELPLPRAT